MGQRGFRSFSSDVGSQHWCEVKRTRAGDSFISKRNICTVIPKNALKIFESGVGSDRGKLIAF